MDTLTLEKQLLDWWFLDGDFIIHDWPEMITQPNNGYPFIRHQQHFKQREDYPDRNRNFQFCQFVPAVELPDVFAGHANEWTRERGFSDGIPDLELGGVTTVPANSSLYEFKASQNASFRFTRIPFTIVSGDAQFSEDNYAH